MMESKSAKSVDIRFTKYVISKKSNVRGNKKLLVLDIDLTLCDFGTYPNPRDASIKRPYLHEFLTRVYAHYDIGLYSASPAVAVRTKVEHMELTSNPNFKILFYLDDSFLISLDIRGLGLRFVKALPIIWHHFNIYNEKNTILVDDNELNFHLNPANGLKIAPYERAQYETDMELVKLAEYLESIATCEDFTKINLKIPY